MYQSQSCLCFSGDMCGERKGQLCAWCAIERNKNMVPHRTSLVIRYTIPSLIHFRSPSIWYRTKFLTEISVWVTTTRYSLLLLTCDVVLLTHSIQIPFTSMRFSSHISIIILAREFSNYSQILLSPNEDEYDTKKDPTVIRL